MCRSFIDLSTTVLVLATVLASILNEKYGREVDIVGVNRYCNTYPMCLDLISSGRVDVKPLITHRYKFSEQDVKAAFEMSAQGANAIKVMFNL